MDSTSIAKIPTETLLSILEEVFESADEEARHPVRADRSLELVDSDYSDPDWSPPGRIQVFQGLAIVCKAWTDLARTVFWHSIELKSLMGIVNFAKDLDKSTAKPNSIRSMNIALPPKVTHGDQSNPLDPALCVDSLLSLRSHLPRQMQLFKLAFTRKCPHSDALYNAWANSGEIRFKELEIWFRPDSRDVHLGFGMFRGMTSLHIKISTLDRKTTFVHPFVDTRLETLSIDVDCMAEPTDHIVDACEALANLLKPACSNLQHLTLRFLYRGRAGESDVVAFRHLQTIGSETVSKLWLVNVQFKDMVDPPFLEALAEVNAISPCPNLRELCLHEFGPRKAAFSQLQCTDMLKLDIVVIEEGSFDGRETFKALMKSLPKMKKLEVLNISFGELPALEDDEDWDYEGTWRIWAPLGRYCDERGILYTIVHPPEVIAGRRTSSLSPEEIEGEFRDYLRASG